MSNLNLEVYTPNKTVLTEAVENVELQGDMGRLGILPEHTSLIARLGFGPLEYSQGGKMQRILCGPGVVEVQDDRVLVLVDSAEHVEEINVDRAEASKKRAEDRLKKLEPDLDVERATLALHRAVERLQFRSERKR